MTVYSVLPEDIYDFTPRSIQPVNHKVTLTVLGGSSIATPYLLSALAESRNNGTLPSLHVRLYGRHIERLNAIARYAQRRLNNQPTGNSRPVELTISTHYSLAEAVEGADFILSQIRPGGMEGRKLDEEIAQNSGIPGDEGLGPSGLSCFLRARPVFEHVAEVILRYAPQSLVLQMTSPLGLNVEYVRRFGVDCVGLCELPMTTGAKILNCLNTSSQTELFSVRHAGLNHQAWIHSIKNSGNDEIITDAIEAVTSSHIIPIDGDKIRSIGAIPLPYLKYFYHAERELSKQRALPQSRADTLQDWILRAESAVIHNTTTSDKTFETILSERHVDWYKHGIVPALEALCSQTPTMVSLNSFCPDGIPNVKAASIVEIPFQVSWGHRHAVKVPALPPGPQELCQQLINYENYLIKNVDELTSSRITTALEYHPFVKSSDTALTISNQIQQNISNNAYI